MLEHRVESRCHVIENKPLVRWRLQNNVNKTHWIRVDDFERRTGYWIERVYTVPIGIGGIAIIAEPYKVLTPL